ncbi:IS3 family transposase (plasmid) [Leptospira sp. WS60.C2]
MKESKERYGSPEIYKELQRKGYSCSKRMVERLMKIGNIRSNIVKKFTVSKPGKVWCFDITYIEIDSR